MAYFEKQPSETFPIGVDFEDVLATGETLVVDSCEVTALDSQGEDVSATVLDNTSKQVSGSQLLIKVLDGTDGQRYKITFQAITSEDNIYEKDVTMIVKDE